MKILITMGVLAVLFASPALAQKSKRVSADARSAHAQQAGPAWQGDTMNGPNGQIMWGGSAKGKDPDPFIRASMSRGYGNMGGL
jgi:hypothetical protein